MKINSTKFNLSFQKTLVANTAYIKDNQVRPAKIYSLDPSKDENYLLKLEDKEKWEMNNYIDNVLYHMRTVDRYKEDYPHCRSDFFVMEDENNECISVLSLETDRYRNETNGCFFEVRTDLSTENENRKAKYIGESFILFVIKWANDVLGTKFVINIPSATARDFYDKCAFEHISDGFYFPQENIDFLAQQNKAHTGVGVNLVG